MPSFFMGNGEWHEAYPTLYKSKPLQVIAASFAKISQRIHRAAVYHVPQFGESLIGRQISVNNLSHNFFRVLNSRRRRENTHPTDHCVESNKLGDVGCLMDKGVRI